MLLKLYVSGLLGENLCELHLYSKETVSLVLPAIFYTVERRQTIAY